MIEEIEPILIGELKDIDKDSMENFEYEEIDYTIWKAVSSQSRVTAIVKSRIFLAKVQLMTKN